MNIYMHFMVSNDTLMVFSLCFDIQKYLQYYSCEIVALRGKKKLYSQIREIPHHRKYASRANALHNAMFTDKMFYHIFSLISM
jgi:hypothetical protein